MNVTLIRKTCWCIDCGMRWEGNQDSSGIFRVLSTEGALSTHHVSVPTRPFPSLSRHAYSHPRAFASALPCAWNDLSPTLGLTATLSIHVSAILSPPQTLFHKPDWLLLISLGFPTHGHSTHIPTSPHASEHWAQSHILSVWSLVHCFSPCSSNINSMWKITHDLSTPCPQCWAHGVLSVKACWTNEWMKEWTKERNWGKSEKSPALFKWIQVKQNWD